MFCRQVVANMSLDSKVWFQDRLEKLNLTNLKAKFDANGWFTLNDFAMAGNYSYGSGDETSLINDIYTLLLDDLSDVRKVGVKRLFLEAFVGHATELKRRATQDDDENKAKKMPTIEKEARYDELKAKYNGLDLENEEQAQPSYKLVDTVVDMMDKSDFRYIKWEECTRRDLEQRGVKRVPGYEEDASGHLKKTSREVAQADAVFNTDSALRFVVLGRGLAYESARL